MDASFEAGEVDTRLAIVPSSLRAAVRPRGNDGVPMRRRLHPSCSDLGKGAFGSATSTSVVPAAARFGNGLWNELAIHPKPVQSLSSNLSKADDLVMIKGQIRGDKYPIMSQKLTGRCSCGKVHYELTSAPMFTHCCHCLDCQRQTGSAFVLNGMIETDRLKVRGEVIETSLPTDSGRPHLVYRCPDCLTALWSDYGARGYLRFVRIGTLDDPSLVSPDVHIFTRSKQPWLQLPADVPAFEVYYDMKSLWPEAALARRQAASDAAKN